MKRWASLNERQHDLLRRINAGAEPVTSAEPALARTTYALRDRGLIEVLRGSGGWTTQVTDAGRFYLEQGHHPDRSQKRRRSGPDTVSRAAAAARPVTRKAPAVWDGQPREHAGMLWKPSPGTSVTFEQFVEARLLVLEIYS